MSVCPIWLPIFSYFSTNEPELGAGINPGMSFNPFPSSIWIRQDSNPQPIDCESSLLTTWPGLRPRVLLYDQEYFFKRFEFKTPAPCCRLKGHFGASSNVNLPFCLCFWPCLRISELERTTKRNQFIIHQFVLPHYLSRFMVRNFSSTPDGKHEM